MSDHNPRFVEWGSADPQLRANAFQQRTHDILQLKEKDRLEVVGHLSPAECGEILNKMKSVEAQLIFLTCMNFDQGISTLASASKGSRATIIERIQMPTLKEAINHGVEEYLSKHVPSVNAIVHRLTKSSLDNNGQKPTRGICFIDQEKAKKLASTGESEHSCTGCGEVEVTATVVDLSSIPMQAILIAAKDCANRIGVIPEGQTVDENSITVRCDGTLSFLLKPLDDQDDEEHRWPEDFQPLTSAKAVADAAYALLATWQRSMLFTYRKDMDVMVFVNEDIRSVENMAKTGDKSQVLAAISAIRSTNVGQIPKQRY